jgi:hypothetical protein
LGGRDEKGIWQDPWNFGGTAKFSAVVLNQSGRFCCITLFELGGWEIVPPLYCSAAKSAMAGLQYAESDKPCSMFGC